MRLQKKRPDGWVIVSMIGYLPNENDAVIALTDRPENIDWRPFTDLDVIVFYKSDTKIDSVFETLNGIIRVYPKTLSCWMMDRSIGFDLVEFGNRCFNRWTAKREAEWEIFKCK
jgi:hypothetical protein